MLRAALTRLERVDILAAMHRGASQVLSLFLLLGCWAFAPSCGRYRPARAYEVRSQADPASTYRAVLAVLADSGYRLVAEDPAARSASVRSHVYETNDKRQSWISIEVRPDGLIRLVGSGYLVRSDGSLHARLKSELDLLEAKIKERAGATPAPQSEAPMAASGSSAAPTASSGPPPLGSPQFPATQGPATQSPAAQGPATPKPLPRAWSEPAYDPKVWGPGQFTCIPVNLSRTSSDFRLRLSNGEIADVLVSIAYAPELCRSASECPIHQGCPALGLADNAKVSALAERLRRGEIQSEATLLEGTRPQAIIDLRKHGSIAQAQGGTGQPPPAKGRPR